jgi:hypothetical protein
MRVEQSSVKPRSSVTVGSPAGQLAVALAKFDPAVARVVRAALSILRRRFATAVELVYDNYNALAIGWGATERMSDVIVTLAVYASGVNLYFMHGAWLPDPKGLLQGSGRQGRFVRLREAAMLSTPAVVALLDAATKAAGTPLPSVGKRRIVIKAVAAKQRPRRRRS